MRFGVPFGVLFFQKDRSQFLATHARLMFFSASCSRLLRHDRKRWVATSGLSSLHGSCSWTRGFYAANPPHTPVGFILSKGLPRFMRVASPSSNFSKDRERVPLMHLSMATASNRHECTSEYYARTDWLSRFRGMPPFIRFIAFSNLAAKTSLILAAFRYRSV